MRKSKDKVATPINTPVSFPRWREVLQSECSDPAELRTREQEIFAWLKFLKAAHRRASVESVFDYLHTLENEGKNTDSVRSSLRWFFKASSIQKGEEIPDSPTPQIREQVIKVEDRFGPDRGERGCLSCKGRRDSMIAKNKKRSGRRTASPRPCR